MTYIEKLLSTILREHNYFKRKDTVNNTSYLYIKSFETDNGGRPLDESQNVSRFSDLKVVRSGLPEQGVFLLQWLWTIEENTEYDITCTLTNRGDIGITAANLEFFFLNFGSDNFMFSQDVEHSARLEIVEPMMYAVEENGDATVTATCNSGGNSGYMAIAARVSSQSPVDLPSDWDNLDPRKDRHCANYIRLWLWWNNFLTFSDTANNTNAESQYRYIIRPTIDHGGELKKELSLHGFNLQKIPRLAKFHFEAQTTNRASGGVTRPSAPRRLSTLGRARGSMSRLIYRKSQWDFNIPKGSKIDIKVKPLNIQIKKNHVMAYELVKLNRKTNKEEGRVTILYARQ